MKRRDFLKTSATIGATSAVTASVSALPLVAASAPAADAPQDGASDRKLWADTLVRIAKPVLTNISAGTLQKNWKVEYSPTWDNRNAKVAYLEAFGRLSMGLAPWLSLGGDATPEGKQREELAAQLRAGIAHAVDPQSPDYMLWHDTAQTLVDAAYLAQALLRAPAVLWEPLDATTKQRVIAEFRGLRRVTPFDNNWVLFAGMTESFLDWVDGSGDQYRLSTILNRIESFYVGDGWYADGPKFHMDYYNSWVIHSMLVDVLNTQKFVVERRKGNVKPVQDRYDQALKRMRRYAEFNERMISPEGTFPAFGRSATYRTAAFQALEHCALLHQLPEGISPGQVRAGISAVIRRMFAMPGIFDAQGWLTLGFAGHQPNIADYYSNSGSMYICSLGFIALGLPLTDPFWSAPAEDWTQKKAWAGQPFKKDYAVDY